MPLPANGTAWPPARVAHIHTAMASWDAWWVGEPDGLARAYGTPAAGPVVRPAQYAGGVTGAVARFFWGRPTIDAGQPRTKLHIPLATDICQASADLLWSEAPTVKVPDVVDEAGNTLPNATQDRLDELIDDRALQTFAEGSEVGAAHGGHFLQVTWDDKVVAGRPFLTVVHADAADAEFQWGRLTAVTFWRVVGRLDGDRVWRHVWRHELNTQGIGVIVHGLYQGTGSDLGVAHPLAEHPATAGLADAVDKDSAISTQSPGLAVFYVPNQRPQRRWRQDPAGASLGRSDLDGIEGIMDALDEVWSSWMRDIRLGKARLLVPETLLDSEGLGKGAGFDLDREVFTPLQTPPTSLQQAGGANTFAQAQQFAIRYAEHQATANELIDTALRTAGYSPATFGRGSDGAAMTAREVSAKQQRSLLTRDRKLRVVRPVIAELLEKLLAVDAAVFNTPGVKAVRPDVEFPDGVQDTLLELAQTAQALRIAEAASTELLVEMVHPEWDGDQVAAEVGRIMAEKSMGALPDPTDPNLVDGASPNPTA